jgi:hypothetical protein
VDLGPGIALPPRGLAGGGGGAGSLGRPRWLDATTLAFTDAGGIIARAIVPGVDTSDTTRRLVTATPGLVAESFAISPDGRFITVAFQSSSSTLAIADHVPGLE